MSAAQRVRSSVAADHRSAHPNLPGVPWWGAVLIALSLTAVGFAFDAGSGNRDLTTAFAVLYIAGCLAAVLAVRQSGVFTAVVQPPLILFVAVPSAYYLFHSSEIHGIKDILINCGYPLIERFLLMFCTSVAVLLIGLARWYFGAANRAAKPAVTPAVADAGPVSAVKAKVSSLFGGPTADDDEDAAAAAAAIAEAPLKHGIDRPATARRTSKDRPTKRTAATRSRHARPPVDDLDGSPAEPRRTRRPSNTRDYDPNADRTPRRDGGRPSERSTRDWQDSDSEARPRRPPRTPRDPDQRTPPPREYRRDPRDSRELRDAREARDPRDRPERSERPRRPNRYEQPEAYEPYEPPRRRPAPGATPGTNGTSSTGGSHHPVSKVRYRGSDAEDGDNRVEYRTPPRRPRHSLED